jgi:hypothetical protein
MQFYSHTTYYRHRNRTGHDARREGVASVPQNITIQYMDDSEHSLVQATSSNDAEGLVRQATQEAELASAVSLFVPFLPPFALIYIVDQEERFGSHHG